MVVQAPRTAPLSSALLNAFAGASTRKLTQDERDAVENYLEILNRTQLTPAQREPLLRPSR